MKNLMVSVTLAASLVGSGVAFAGPRADAEAGLGRHRGAVHVYDFAAAFAEELGISARTLEQIKAAEDGARVDFQRLRLALVEARNAVAAGADESLLDTAEAALSARRRALRAQIDGMLTPTQRRDLATVMGVPSFSARQVRS